jgi:DNA replication and repair protein RecF
MGLPFQHVLEEIRLIQFRCFESLIFHPDCHCNLIVGPNAQGKTSLLEAICVLLRLQSPRTSILAPLILHGQTGFSVEGTCSGHHLQMRFEKGQRKFRLDSVEQKSLREYLAVARVAWFANSDGELVRGGSSIRRRYLDFMGSQMDPNYLSYLRAYERAWKSRNLLLKEGSSSKEIHAFDEPLVASGEALAACRRTLVEALAPLFSQAAREISGKEEVMGIHYERGFQSDFRQELLASEHEERRLIP